MLREGLFILLISSTGYTLTVESSPAGPTALVPPIVGAEAEILGEGATDKGGGSGLVLGLR